MYYVSHLKDAETSKPGICNFRVRGVGETLTPNSKILCCSKTYTTLGYCICKQSPICMILFTLLVIFRFLNAIFIETQFDPDEYWQSLEPAYCFVFSPDGTQNCALTWEWTRRLSSNDLDISSSWINIALNGPVRSYVPVLPIIVLYKFLKIFHLDSNWAVAKCPILLNAILVSAPTDYAVYYISKCIYGIKSDPKERKADILHRVETWSLLASLTSWFHAYALIRTYSNSLETALLAVGVALLCPELFDKRNVAYDQRIRPLAQLAFILGGLSVVIRFTALASWIPLGIIVSIRRGTNKSRIYYFTRLCIVCGTIGVGIGCIVDRLLYGFWAIPFIGNFHFNVILGLGSLYGTHPWFWYVIAGLPAIAGILTPLFIFEYLRYVKTKFAKTKDRWQIREEVLFVIIGSYITLHSYSAHKEFRFILPILPFVCVISGRVIQSLVVYCERSVSIFASCLVVVLALFNIPQIYFLGRIHQRGPLCVNSSITTHIQQQMKASNLSSVSIHYLMGCHSTPLYSHLHIPVRESVYQGPFPIEARYLDCSPQCRTDAQSICESDRFERDPYAFIQEEYLDRLVLDQCAEDESTTCKGLAIYRDLPDIVVINQHNLLLHGVSEFFLATGFQEIDSCRHSIKGMNFEGEDLRLHIEYDIFSVLSRLK